MQETGSTRKYKKYNNVQEEEGQELPEVKQGEPLKFVKIDPQQNFTQPPG